MRIDILEFSRFFPPSFFIVVVLLNKPALIHRPPFCTQVATFRSVKAIVY